MLGRLLTILKYLDCWLNETNRASFGHNAPMRRIDPRHPELPTSISKMSLIFDFQQIHTSRITDFKEISGTNIIFLEIQGISLRTSLGHQNMDFPNSGDLPTDTKYGFSEISETSSGRKNMNFHKSWGPPQGRKIYISDNVGTFPVAKL